MGWLGGPWDITGKSKGGLGRGAVSLSSATFGGGDEPGAGSNTFTEAPTISPGSFTGSGIGATTETGEPQPQGADGGHSVWWKFVAPATQSYSAALLRAAFIEMDGVLGVYTGASVDALTEVASDWGSYYPLSVVSFNATMGTAYYFLAVNGWVDEAVAGSVVTLTVSASALGLSNSGTSLTTLDLSAMPDLMGLNCSNNLLTALDVSDNPALVSLDCSQNQLAALDLSAHTALVYANCATNDLTTLDVSGSEALVYLYCQHNGLTALDLSDTAALTQLDCSDNAITALDASANPDLVQLDCDTNQLTTLTLPASTTLVRADCKDNLLTALDLSVAPALTNVDGSNNALTQAAVDAVLVALDGHGLSNGQVVLTGNAAPSAAGLTAKTSLEGKGWTVTVDS